MRTDWCYHREHRGIEVLMARVQERRKMCTSWMDILHSFAARSIIMILCSVLQFCKCAPLKSSHLIGDRQRNAPVQRQIGAHLWTTMFSDVIHELTDSLLIPAGYLAGYISGWVADRSREPESATANEGRPSFSFLPLSSAVICSCSLNPVLSCIHS